jgi:hypothetical protein
MFQAKSSSGKRRSGQNHLPGSDLPGKVIFRVVSFRAKLYLPDSDLPGKVIFRVVSFRAKLYLPGSDVSGKVIFRVVSFRAVIFRAFMFRATCTAIFPTIEAKRVRERLFLPT